MARAPDLPLSRSVATGGGGHMHYRLQRTSAQWPHVVGRKVVGRRALRSSFKSTRDSSMNYTLARSCLSSGVVSSGFPPRKRCERVCDRAYFSHTGGSRPPLAKIEDHSMQRGHRWWRGTWYRLTVYDNTVYHSTRLLTLSCLDTARAVWIRLDATHPAVNPHLSPAFLSKLR